MKDYKNLNEVIVTNQAEMDEIPLNYRGRIYIECKVTVAVKNRYYFRTVARGNSSVVARGNSSVEARGNSSVVANGNSQIVDRQLNGKIQISGNARTVYMPKNANDFISFYGVKHTKTKATFYKAVRKDGETYRSDYNRNFVYEIGKTIKAKCDPSADVSCSFGIHIAHLGWAVDYGKDWKDLAIIEVETKIADIVVPTDTDGKVRTSEVKVIREVPLEECGLYGKILAKKRGVPPCQ